MTKYVGRHRNQPRWTPWKTLSCGIVITAFLAIPLNSGSPPVKELKEIKPKIATVTTHVSIAPPTPDPEPVNGGRDEFESWIEEGMPGYIPDNRDAKGLVPPETPVPEITVIQATCDKPDLPGLADSTLNVYHIVCALFPEISTFGGYRAGDQDHGTGHAIDCMVYGDYDTGEALATWVIAHADDLDIKYVIWQQQIWGNWDGGRQWTPMEDRGSPTANHRDHVHLSVY